MTDEILFIFGDWLLPDRATISIAVFWIVLTFLAWLETVAPAQTTPSVRERRWPTNFGLGIVNMILVPLVPVSALIGAYWAQRNGWGLLNLLELSYWLVFVATILIRSLVGYVLHLLLHKIGAFWRVHRVHHSDDHLDVSTTIRAHPLELLLMFLVTASLAVLLGLDPVAIIATELTESIVSLCSHANLRLPERIDRPLRWVFVTPNMHSIHHSSYQPETDSNYGQVFTFWDRLFGTYSDVPRGGYDAMQIGLEEIREERASDFWLQMKSPIMRSLEK